MKVYNTSGRLWIEEGEHREGVVAEVAPIFRTHKTYSYAVPTEMEDTLTLGQRINIPLGRKGTTVQGFVINLDRKRWDSTLKPITDLVDPASYLTKELIELGQEIATHYSCGLGRTLKAMTPEGVRKQRGFVTVRYVNLEKNIEALQADNTRITPKRLAILESLSQCNEPMPVDQLLSSANATASVLRLIEKLGWVSIETRKEEPVDVEPPKTQIEPDFKLNEEQQHTLQKMIEAIDDQQFSVTLLQGVSGCGKTEVYIHAIRHVLKKDQQAIMLVPEIVLTTQLVQRLADRFTDVAVLHSGLTDSQRSLIWRQITSGEKNVIIGTRSAVFAPCPNLGLIVVDEEQETSFKNLQEPRFHVRDVAIMRAKQLNIPVMLGSATPSVETWFLSGYRKDYRRVQIKKRVRDLPMPKVLLIDMREEMLEQKRSVILSRPMVQNLKETLARNQQSIILMNRRGFANRLTCPSCNSRITCPNCNIGLVMHTSTGHSICHYCHRRINTPKTCPNLGCGQPLIAIGLGTQRIEDVLKKVLPAARIERVDSDTMKHRSHYERIVNDFESRKIDILVGTQMIAKGLDFPFVSFVGVMQADTGMLSADFRANERLFQLITQVAGRAGRADATGKVVVQTMMPELPALKHAVNHDYESFVTEELESRKKVGWPPFRRIARLVLTHTREETVKAEANAMAEKIRDTILSLNLEYADVMGANPCVLSRLKNKYRYELLLRTLDATSLRKLLAQLQQDNTLRTKADSIILDVDPVSLT